MTLDAHGDIDHEFRRNAARLVAALTRVTGAVDLDHVEEAVQDAFSRALDVWPYQGTPVNPAGWLYRVAYNRLRDIVRRELNGRNALSFVEARLAPSPSPAIPEEITDQELALIFLCCHPALPVDSRVALTLKVACGFSVEEIGAAMLTAPSTIAQRLVRAKRVLRDRAVDLALPAGANTAARLDSVLTCVYLMFTEGHDAHGGAELVREDLCFEAIRLAELLVTYPPARRPKVHALLALMLLQASRLRARCREGSLVPLEDQDRGLWDWRLVCAGMRHLDASAQGDELSAYHVEAVIAAEFVVEQVNWTRVLRLHDQLLELNPSPLARLNRAVALGKVAGPRAGLRALGPLFELSALRGYHLLPCIAGALHDEAGEPSLAAAAYRSALALTCNEIERRFITDKMHALEARARATERNSCTHPEASHSLCGLSS